MPPSTTPTTTPAVAPVIDPSAPAPFSLGTPGEQTPAPVAPAADTVPAWAQQFMTRMDERLNGLESAITADPTPSTQSAASQPIGTPAPTESELQRRNPQSWADVDAYVAEQVQSGVQRGIQEFTQSLQDQNAAAQRAKEQVDAELDAQVASLETAGLLPPISNPNDRNDPGRVYRRELYGAAAKLGTTDLKAVAEVTLKPLHDQGKLYDPVSDSIIDYNAPIAGANAPIGSSTTTTGATPGGPSYADIHKARGFDELRARAGL